MKVIILRLTNKTNLSTHSRLSFLFHSPAQNIASFSPPCSVLNHTRNDFLFYSYQLQSNTVYIMITCNLTIFINSFIKDEVMFYHFTIRNFKRQQFVTSMIMYRLHDNQWVMDIYYWNWFFFLSFQWMLCSQWPMPFTKCFEMFAAPMHANYAPSWVLLRRARTSSNIFAMSALSVS